MTGVYGGRFDIYRGSSMATRDVAVKRRRGGQTIRTPKLDSQIVAWVASGQTLRDFCRKPGSPGHAVVYNWLNGDEGFAGRFARAREVGHEAIAEEALALADEPPPLVDGRVDHGYVAWVKNRVWTRLQLLAKWNPGRYGDRPPEAPVVQVIQLSNADAAREVAMLLATAAARKVLADREEAVKAIEHQELEDGEDD